METYRRPFPASARDLVDHLADLGYRVFYRRRYRNALNPGHGAWDAVSWSISEADTGRSAFHYQSRRDEAFRQLQALRSTCPPVMHRGRVIEL